MNINIKIFLLCPIPEDQKPINEYISLKKNPFTNWIKSSNSKYRNNLLKLVSIFVFIFTLLQLKTFQLNLLNFQLIEKILLFSLFFFCIFLVVVLSPWQKVEKRLNATKIFYEEASWFDGQIWEKPFLILKNDRLLKLTKVEPTLLRSQKILLQLILIICFLLIFN